MKCENCGEEAERESVDVGVGVIHGPWGCYACGWSEDPKYDCRGGSERPGGFVDPLGGFTPVREEGK